MTSDWSFLPASEFCESVRDGTHDSPKEVISGGRNLVTSRHIKGGVLDLGKSYRISVDDFNEINKRSKVDQWDILFSMIGTVGETLLVKEDNPSFAIKNVGLFKNKSELSGRWLYYFLNSPDTKREIESLSRGTTQQYVPLGALRSLQVRFPSSKHCQQQIVDILGTLDDKIELNRKTNETLEGIAKALFKSWFVKFEPVKAKAEGRPTGLPDDISDLFPDSFEESELGEIPSGWSPSSVGEISKNLDRLRVPLSKKQRSEKQGAFPYYGATGVFDYVDHFLFDGDYLLIGEDGSVAKEDGTAFSQYVSGQIWVNNHAHVLEGILPVTTEFLYCFFQFAQVTPYVTGAVQLKLSQGRMNMIQLPLADEKLLCLFGETVRPIFSRIQSIQKEILSLGELRDVLLPRLISGELRVPDAEKMLEEVGI